MSSKFKADKKIRNQRKNINNLILNYKLKNQNIPLIKKLNLLDKKTIILSKIFVTKINNYCLFTNRSKGVLKKFKVSRIIFKKLVQEKVLIGIKKAS